MSDNVFDFAQRLQQLQAKAETPVPLEQYRLDAAALIMDPALQLDTMLTHAAGLFNEGDLDQRHIHRLLTVLKYVYEGVHPEFDLKTSIIPRMFPNEEGSTRWSVYTWGMNMARMRNDGVPTPGFHPSFQLEANITEFDEGSTIDKGTIYPEDWMVFDIAEEDCMTKRLPRHFVKKMNSLVTINGGCGVLADDGTYMVVLPWGGRLGLVLALALENPITLIPEEERKR